MEQFLTGDEGGAPHGDGKGGKQVSQELVVAFHDILPILTGFNIVHYRITAAAEGQEKYCRKK